MSSTKNGVCDVCRILDRDHSIKLVTYCALCRVFMCATCEKDKVRRMKAMYMIATGEAK